MTDILADEERLRVGLRYWEWLFVTDNRSQREVNVGQISAFVRRVGRVADRMSAAVDVDREIFLRTRF